MNRDMNRKTKIDEETLEINMEINRDRDREMNMEIK